MSDDIRKIAAIIAAEINSKSEKIVTAVGLLEEGAAPAILFPLP